MDDSMPSVGDNEVVVRYFEDNSLYASHYEFTFTDQAFNFVLFLMLF